MSGIEQSEYSSCKNVALEHGPGAAAAHVVVIALSAGGLLPMRVLLRRLPWDLPAAVIALQHVSGISYLPSILQPGTHLNVKFAEPGELLRCGNVYVGPPGRHLVISPEACLTLVDSPRVRFARPSADWLFDSAAAVFGDRAVAVVLSGRLSDGARGVARMNRAGSHVIAQDPRTCRFPDMPIAAIRTGAVHDVLAPEDVAPAIIALLAARDIAAEAREWREPFAVRAS